MAITLSGRLLDDVGAGINDATVKAIPVGSGTPDATTTTAAHPTTGENGWWTFTNLAENKVYYVSVEWQSKKRQFYGLSAVQLNRLTVGKAACTISEDGQVWLKAPGLPGGNKVDSPAIVFTGKHGADPGTTKQMSINNTVGGDGTYALEIQNDLGSTVGKITHDGKIYAGGTEVSKVGHGHSDVISGGASGFMTGADKAKLDGIEAGATGDQTAAEVHALVVSVSGHGQGLNADMVDGQHASAFAAANHSHGSTGDASRLISPNGTKWAHTTDQGSLKMPGGIGGIRKIRWLTGLSGTGAHAHGLGETPNVVLPITRGPTAYASVGYNWADATNIYINSSMSGNEFSCLVMVVD